MAETKPKTEVGGYRVTVTPTIQDGTVIRWFRSDGAMDRCEPVVSASRKAVIVHRYDIETTVDREELNHLVDWALGWQVRIKMGEKMSHLATHEREHTFGGKWVEVR